MKIKIITFFLALVAGTGTMFAEKVKIGDLYYNLDATNQTAEVAENRSASGDIIIPSSVTYNSVSYSVTSIGDYAFADCSGLTSVTIPNSVTSIGDYAFGWCNSLTSVTIPNSVTNIGDDAFLGCTGLTSVTIGNSVTSIGNAAFYGCSGLTSVTIPNSVTSIGDGVFADCAGLISVTIPGSVTSIGDLAFLVCTGLTSVTIPNSVTSIGDRVFYNCSSLTSIIVENGNSVYDSRNNCNAIIKTATNTLITGCQSTIIPNSVTSIGEGAFLGCSGLTSVTIPNSVTSIGDYAFLGCSGLTSVSNFANTPQEIDSYVFGNVDKSTCVLYVPAGSISAYQSADGWEEFYYILPIGAQPVDVTTTMVTAFETTADITWPKVNGAAIYTIEIKKNGELVCTLTFDAEGQLISIAFNAPSRNNAPQQTQAAGFSFTITSLDSGTTYSYTMTAKGNNGNVLKTESGSFTTTGESQGIEETSSSLQGGDRGRLILHNGQIFILRGEKVYTLTGQETIVP